MEDLRPTISLPLIEQESYKRAIKRREVINEILSTEADYVLGLKALVGVFVSLYIFGFGCQLTNPMRFSGSFHVFNKDGGLLQRAEDVRSTRAVSRPSPKHNNAKGSRY